MHRGRCPNQSVKYPDFLHFSARTRMGHSGLSGLLAGTVHLWPTACKMAILSANEVSLKNELNI
jgi:hypothetical protein